MSDTDLFPNDNGWEPRAMLAVEDRVCPDCGRFIPHAQLQGWRTGRTWWEPAPHGRDGRPRASSDADVCVPGSHT